MTRFGKNLLIHHYARPEDQEEVQMWCEDCAATPGSRPAPKLCPLCRYGELREERDCICDGCRASIRDAVEDFQPACGTAHQRSGEMRAAAAASLNNSLFSVLVLRDFQNSAALAEQLKAAVRQACPEQPGPEQAGSGNYLDDNCNCHCGESNENQYSDSNNLKSSNNNNINSGNFNKAKGDSRNNIGSGNCACSCSINNTSSKGDRGNCACNSTNNAYSNTFGPSNRGPLEPSDSARSGYRAYPKVFPIIPQAHKAETTGKEDPKAFCACKCCQKSCGHCGKLVELISQALQMIVLSGNERKPKKGRWKKGRRSKAGNVASSAAKPEAAKINDKAGQQREVQGRGNARTAQAACSTCGSTVCFDSLLGHLGVACRARPPSRRGGPVSTCCHEARKPTNAVGAGDAATRTGCRGGRRCPDPAPTAAPTPTKGLQPISHYPPGVVLNRSGDCVRCSLVRTAAGATLHECRQSDLLASGQTPRPNSNLISFSTTPGNSKCSASCRAKQVWRCLR